MEKGIWISFWLVWFMLHSMIETYIHYISDFFRCRDLLNRGHYITFLLGSAMTISSDLGLNRPTYRDTPGLFERLTRRFVNIPDFKDSAGTLEERRTFLGYFYLSSVYVPTSDQTVPY
jgi:hypothetical protein